MPEAVIAAIRPRPIRSGGDKRQADAPAKPPRAYVERSVGLALATAIFWAEVIPAYLSFIRHEGKLTDIKGWREFYRIAFGEVGFLRKMARPWFDYFRPGFNPWDHDNMHFLETVEAYSAPFQRKSGPMARAA